MREFKIDIKELTDGLIKLRDSMDYVGMCEGIYFDQQKNMINAEKLIYKHTGKLWAELSNSQTKEPHPLWIPKEIICPDNSK